MTVADQLRQQGLHEGVILGEKPHSTRSLRGFSRNSIILLCFFGVFFYKLILERVVKLLSELQTTLDLFKKNLIFVKWHRPFASN